MKDSSKYFTRFYDPEVMKELELSVRRNTQKVLAILNKAEREERNKTREAKLTEKDK